MRRASGLLCLLLAAAGRAPDATAQAGGHAVVAVFAHPDDERIVGPLLARYAREGRDVYGVSSGASGSGGSPSWWPWQTGSPRSLSVEHQPPERGGGME